MAGVWLIITTKVYMYMYVPESGRRGTPGRSCRLSACQC